MAKIQEAIAIKATPKECYAVVWDYAKYPEFVQGVSATKIKKQKKDVIEVTFALNLIKQITYSVLVTGKPHTRIDWHLISGSVFKKIIGSWDFLESKKGMTLATYTLEVEFGLFVPSPITKILIGANLPQMLNNFKQRIEHD